MNTIEYILQALDERNLARRIGIKHDEARMRFPLNSNTVASFDEFNRVIGAYYSHHFSQCVAPGGTLDPYEARVRAKEALEKEYRRRDGDIVTAFNDAHEGTNGGMRVILDVIAQALRTESLDRFIREIFETHVAPNSWETKVEIIRQFIERCGVDLSTSLRTDQPERYAHEHQVLIKAYVEGLSRTSATFRRL